MRRTEQVQGLRLMKFAEVYGRTHRGGLSQAEAAEVLGVSERTFRRWRDGYEAEGADGLYDRRLGRLSARRASVDGVARVLELFDTRYWDLTAKHFHEKLVADHGFKRSYNWLRLRECQKICARAVLSDIDEPFAEDDGELCFGLEPFLRRTFPRLGRMIENEI